MKFSIAALGLLFAGFVQSQLAQPKQTNIDNFLRESQHLKPSAQLVSIKEQGPIATVTYQDGPVNFKYDVRSDGKDMKVVGIQQVMTFSGNFQFNPANIPKPSIQIDKLPPLPLMMPQFMIQNNGQVQMRNVFDRVEKQIMEMQQRMQQDKFNLQHEMQRKRQQMRENFNKHFNIATQQAPLIGGDHDFNWATTEIQIQPNQPLIGGGDHDMNWATIQFQKEHPLIGDGDHDIWEGQPVDFKADHPLVGGDGHDNWQNKKKKCHKNLKNEEIIGGDGHDDWRSGKHHGMKHKKSDKKQKRHHSFAAWMNKQFTPEQVKSYMTQRLPDLMSESQIVSVQQKGFEKGKGFKLDIQIKDKQGQLQSVSAYFKPRKQEFSIEKISKIKKESTPLETGKELLSEVMKNLKDEFMKPAIEIVDQQKEVKETKTQETQNLVTPKQVSEQPKQFLLGGENDPDHEVDFMKMPEQIQVHQDNHISEHKDEEVYQVALLEEEKDTLPVEEKENKQVQVVLPSGKSDSDQNIDTELALKEALKIVQDILEEEQVEDIEEVEEVEEPKEQKRSQMKQKLQLLTHRR